MHFCWFDPFEEQFISPFLSDCPSLMLGIAIHCIQHSQAMLERGVCELAHSFFHWCNYTYPYLHFVLLKDQAKGPGCGTGGAWSGNTCVKRGCDFGGDICLGEAGVHSWWFLLPLNLTKKKMYSSLKS